MGIWRNIGKIVILVFQITQEQVKWYVGSWGITKKSNELPSSNRLKSNPLDEISKIKKDNIIEKYNEEQESRERSKLMVELCEKPYYNIKPE